MTYTEQAIHDARKGGYEIDKLKANPHAEIDGVNLIVEMEAKSKAFLLDPLFWQSLGKTLGWTGQVEWWSFENVNGSDSPEHEETKHYDPQWIWYWRCFIDYLAGGGDAESFFESLK